ncbi:FAD-binding molybdopterin dehydrogenase [Nostocales cyanobacterium HT-58-2]|nr:FAD-binding molybdopterin dehydrogenase [Nostocales cyanobacterium HT-58-2]
MKPFSYTRADSSGAAVGELSNNTHAKFICGGTNLLDLMKSGVEQPDRLIDINRLPLAEIEELPSGGVRIGAMARNSHTANHPLIRQRYPMLSQAFLSGATEQLRNMATVGGNLMQKTRCYYFYDTAMPCNKREPGTGCGALEGYNRTHAILGASEHCIATHPSDMCVALAALDAVVRVTGANGDRQIPITEFYRLPGDTPHIDTNLGKDELITGVDLPRSPFAARSYYLKIRDRASYAFALVSVAAALDIENNTIKAVRLALGGVAHKPWRATQAEEILVGSSPNEEVFTQAAEVALQGAQPRQYNAFKVELAKRAIVRALATVGEMS